MNTSKQYISGLTDAAMRLPDLISSFDVTTNDLNHQLMELKSQGLIYATEHWKDGKYMTLLYPIKPGQPRQRKYVGNDPAKVKEARAQIQRAKEYDAIAQRVQRIDGMLAEALRQLASVTQTLSKAC
jgi:hypothetical protein